MFPHRVALRDGEICVHHEAGWRTLEIRKEPFFFQGNRRGVVADLDFEIVDVGEGCQLIVLTGVPNTRHGLKVDS